MSHSSLSKYYEDMFIMWYDHKYPMSEWENLIPYERDLIVTMVNTRKKDEDERARLTAKQQAEIANARRTF